MLGFELVIQWIPSHSGIAGNELVDFLARESLSYSDITELGFELDECLSVMKHKFGERKVNDWNINRVGNFFSSMIEKLDDWRWISSGNRMCDVVMARMRSGVVGLNPFLFVLGRVDSPNCIYCLNVEETIQHYLLDCPRHVFARNKLFSRLNLIGVRDDTITVAILLSGSDFSPGIRRLIIRYLYDYFKDTKKMSHL